MGRKLFKILLENDFIEINEHDNPFDGTKNITMILRVKNERKNFKNVKGESQ